MSGTDRGDDVIKVRRGGGDGGRLGEIARLFLRLGFTAFGGPAAHVGMIEDEVVVRRRWIDRQHFLDLLSAVNFIPGPNSTELAIHLGWVRAGMPGLVVAGVCFIVPAVLIILPIAWAYVTYGAVPEVRGVMAGINAAVIAVVAAAVWRFGRASITDRFTAVVTVAALAASIAARWLAAYEPDLTTLAAAAAAGMIRTRWRQRRPPLPPSTTPLLLPIGVTGTTSAKLAEMFLFFLKVGGTLFGSGYVLISYLQSGLVDQLHWLDKRQVLDAVAVGQVTPGPLLTTATFLGYLLGNNFGHGSTAWSLAGGIIATAGIFLPSFVFVAVLGPILPKIRRHPLARGALDAMNAAVVALIAVAGWRLGRAAVTDWLTAAVFAASLAGLLIWRLNATWLVAAGAIVGAAAALAR